jgi:hypothetical protein
MIPPTSKSEKGAPDVFAAPVHSSRTLSADDRPVVEPTFATVGEQLLGRALDKEVRASVEHYVPGQMQAVRYPGREYGTDRPCEIGRVTYVDVMGHACVVLTLRYLDVNPKDADAQWFATWVGRAGQTWQDQARRVDKGEFDLSEKMLDALHVAPLKEHDE